MEDLKKVNEEIKKIKAREYQREWRKNNKEKKRLQNKKWNEEKGKEYHKAYYYKKRKESEITKTKTIQDFIDELKDINYTP